LARQRRPFLIVGNPQNRRVAFFQQALRDAGRPPAVVVPYLDLLERRTTLAAHLTPDALVRIESPERDFAVEKALLRHGLAAAEAEGAPVLSRRQIDEAPFDRGLILHPRQNYLGFRRLLRSLARDIAAAPGVGVLNAPADIEVMFDKRLCHERTRAAGVPVPPALSPVRDYEELVERMTAEGQPRVFVKLANGSAASGVVALHRQGQRIIALTTAELVRADGAVRLYNSRKIRCYSDERDLAAIINALCREGVHVEQWLPKAILDEHGNLDLRFVVIGGRAGHVVMRQSKSPITNLHLLNRRGDVERLRERVGAPHWAALQATCVRAMALFPKSLYAGIDLLLMPGLRRHAVLEVNAFGDLLPNVLHEGRDTYAAELAAAP
jgi:glutathione synthase/RimK-type ligase-like ATP-grasp enzyme